LSPITHSGDKRLTALTPSGQKGNPVQRPRSGVDTPRGKGFRGRRVAEVGVKAGTHMDGALRQARGGAGAPERPGRSAGCSRILFFNWRDRAHPAAGGAEVYVEEVARRLVERGHAVTLFSAAVDGMPERDVRDGVEHVRRGSRFSVYREARRFWRTEAAGAFDLVVDCINTRPFATVRFVKDAPVVGLAYQVAREVWWYEAPLPAAALGRFVLEPHWLRRYRDTPVLTISASSQAALASYGLRRVSVIPVGIDIAPTTAPPAKDSRPTIVFCGRLVRSKRPEHAVAALTALRRSVPDARLVVIGSGPLEARLRARAPEGVEIRGRVTREEKEELVRSAHALVVTSVREGWGLVVSEAAALGTPSVAYDVPGLRDSVRAADGALCDPQPEAMAATLVERLPGWIANPPAPLPWGGARDWDTVTDALLAAAGIGAKRSEGADAGTHARGAA
jgi:glycosyltransferase involved in cell wall biosynthesis